MAENLEFIIGAKDRFSSKFAKLQSGLPAIGRLAKTAAVAFAGLGAAIFAMAKTTATAYDKVQKLSDRLGVSTEFLSKMAYAADLSGVKIEAMQKAVEMLSVRIQEANKGTGLAVEAFDKLNVSLTDSNGQLRTSADIMPDIAEAFGNMTNATERTAAAYQIFGMRGTAMIQMFKDGKVGLEEMTSEAEKFGLVVSAKAGANAAEFNDSLTRLIGSMKGVKNAFAEELMKPLSTGFNNLAEIIADNRDKIVDSLKAIADGMVSFVDVMMQAAALSAESLGTIFMGLEKMLFIYQKIQEFMLLIAKTGNAPFTKDLIWAIENTIKRVEELRSAFGDTGGKIKDMKAEIQGLRATLAAFFADSFGGGGDEPDVPGVPGQDALDAAAERYQTYLDAMAQSYSDWAGINIEIAENLADQQATIEQAKADALRDIMSNMYSAMGSLGKQYFELMKNVQTIDTIIATYSAAMKIYNSLAWLGPLIAGAAAAATVIAGMGRVAQIRAQSYPSAHGGMTTVPSEQTYLLDQGERVLSPNQNQDLIDFMQSGGGGGGTTVNATLNFPNTDLSGMSKSEVEDFAEQKIAPALNKLAAQGLY